jgi:hypothetical protein
MTVIGSWLVWATQFHLPDASSTLGVGWSFSVLLVGVCLCLRLTSKAPKPRKFRETWLGFALLLPILLVTNPLCWTRSSPAALRDQLASMQLNPGELGDWSEAAALHHTLQSLGAPLPDLSELKTKLESAIDSGVDCHPEVWSSALQMDLIDAAHRARLAQHPYEQTKLSDLRTRSGALRYIRFEAYLVGLLREELDGDPALRRHIADRIEASWPEPDAYGPLEDALLCVRALDAIGATTRADALREPTQALLVSHWVSSGAWFFSKAGGFTSDPVKFRTSFDDQTWFAVQLMERFGVPPEIDLRLLRGHLRTESRVMFFDTAFSLNAMSRASLRVLEDKIGMPPRSPLQRVLDERLLIASLLLVGLCLLAIRLAPSFEPDTSRGAQP